MDGQRPYHDIFDHYQCLGIFPVCSIERSGPNANNPPVLYKAAKVDGAGAFRRFIHITLPQLRNVLFVVILLRSIWMFTKFDTVWLLTQGGGAEKYIRTLPVYAYMRTFMYYQAGLGAALAVIMFIILTASTAIYFKMFRREEEI